MRKKILTNLSKLRWKLFLAFIVLILVTLPAITFYYNWQMKKQLTQEFQKRAKALTENLAHNAKYGVVAKDKESLGGLLDGIIREDVIYGIIYDIEGTILAQKSSEGISLSTLEWDTSFVQQKKIN